MIQAGFSFVLSIWSVIVDGSFLRFYSLSLKSRENAPRGHFSQEVRNVLSIPHQLQTLYIEKMSEIISDVQTLNGEKVFTLAVAKELTNLIRHIAAHWGYGSTSKLESLPFPHHL